MAKPAEETQATQEQKDDSKIKPSHVNEENFGAYLKQAGFPAAEWKKIKGVKLSKILENDKTGLEVALQQREVDGFEFATFLKAVGKIPGSKLNANSQSGMSVLKNMVILDCVFPFVSFLFFVVLLVVLLVVVLFVVFEVF